MVREDLDLAFVRPNLQDLRGDVDAAFGEVDAHPLAGMEGFSSWLTSQAIAINKEADRH